MFTTCDSASISAVEQKAYVSLPGEEVATETGWVSISKQEIGGKVT